MLHSPYRELFGEIGKIWDLSEENSLGVSDSVSELRNHISALDEKVIGKQKKEVIEELVDVTTQIYNLGENDENEGLEEGVTVSISKRVHSSRGTLSYGTGIKFCMETRIIVKKKAYQHSRVTNI